LGFHSALADDSSACRDAATPAELRVPACTQLLENHSQPSDVNEKDIYLWRGNAKFKLSDFSGAVADYTSSLNRDPKNVDALQSRGLAYQMLGNYDEALKNYNTALGIKKTAPLYNMRSTVLYSKEEFGQAIQDATAAIDLDRQFAKAYLNRGLAYHSMRQLNLAVADFDKFIHLAPKVPLGYDDRAAVLMDLGKIGEAIEDYDRAVELDPNRAATYSHRGEAWDLKGDFDRALADHNKAIEIEPNADAYIDRALAWQSKGDLDKAIADCDAALLINPNNYLAYANRGAFFRLKGDTARAFADLNKAHNLNPRSAVALTFRGDLLRANGETDKAIADYQDALLSVSDFVAAIVGRGIALEAKQQRAKAQDDFKKALSLSSDIDARLARPAQKLAREHLTAMAEADAKLQKETAGALEAKNTAEAEARAQDIERKKQAEAAIAAAKLEAAKLEAAKLEIAKLESAKLETAKAEADPPINPGVRVALVIGNSGYSSVPILPNPERDAQAVGDTFRKIGFQKVIVETNLTRDGFIKALRKFSDLAATADWAVIYYAGHGLSFGGSNYLIPVDAELKSDKDLTYEAVPLDMVMSTLDRAKKLRLVVLDACRNNPFIHMAQADPKRSIERGLAPIIDPETGTLVFYAAQEGKTARDGNGVHSPFTEAFLQNVVKPKVEIELQFRQIAHQVYVTTKKEQLPFKYGSLPEEAFYFVPNKPKDAHPPAPSSGQPLETDPK
jgi:tetratricopeptide (TPR) repeat protein